MNLHILPFAEEDAKIRLFFMDEAAFGRINDISRCWAPSGVRPIVPYQMVREYRQVYGAVDPISGDDFYIIAPGCNTMWTNAFFSEFSKELGKDYALICLDNAGWHKSKALEIPDNIRLFYIPKCTPEMNPIEQVWPVVRKEFKNKLYKTLDNLVDNLCNKLNSLNNELIKSITGREWVLSMF